MSVQSMIYIHNTAGKCRKVMTLCMTFKVPQKSPCICLGVVMSLFTNYCGFGPFSQVCTHEVQCPVCGQVLAESADNMAVNRHIDECLNRSAIGAVTESPSKTAGVAAEMSSRPSSKRGAKKEQPATGGSRKRRSKSGTFEEDPKRRKTLDQFWKHN